MMVEVHSDTETFASSFCCPPVDDAMVGDDPASAWSSSSSQSNEVFDEYGSDEPLISSSRDSLMTSAATDAGRNVTVPASPAAAKKEQREIADEESVVAETDLFYDLPKENPGHHLTKYDKFDHHTAEKRQGH